MNILSTIFVTIFLLRLTTALTCDGYKEEVTFIGCDGTCAHPTPDCLLITTEQERCGCPPGYVRDDNSNECQNILQCDYYEGLPTPCQHEALINNEIKCDENGYFEMLQIIGGKRKCVHMTDGVEFPAVNVVDGVIVDCADKLKCDKVGLSSEWTTRKCDGTCGDPTPSCTFEHQEEKRCGCSIGHVVVIEDYEKYCKPVYQCDNRDDLLTQCQLEALFNYQVQCNVRGWYKKKQKNGQETKCVHPKTGNTIVAKHNSDGSFIDCNELSNCQLDFYKNEDYSFDNKDYIRETWFECDDEGNYKPKQCWTYFPCKCVVPITGTQIPIHGDRGVEKDFDCKNAVLTKCQTELVAKDLMNHRNETKVELPNCWNYGYYSLLHCDEMDMCQCRNPITGQLYPGRNVVNPCYTWTACQRQYNDVDDNVERKPCDDDGRFISKYCTNEVCMCLDVDSGEMIPNIQPLPISQRQQLVCPDPICTSNMEWSDCAGCDRVCSNIDKQHLCEKKCRRKCRCPENLVWSRLLKTCVTQDACDEEYFY